MRHRLRSVQQNRHPARVGELDDFFHRHHGSKRVGDMGNRNELGPLVEQPAKLIEHQLAIVIDRNDSETRAHLLAEHLPGHDVGMVLHGGHDNFIARAEKLPPIALRHEIDRLGGAANENNLLQPAGVDEAPEFFPRLFVERGRQLAQIMHATVNIGVLLGVITVQRVDDRMGFLAGGAVIEIDQRLAVNLTGEQRKILADALNVEQARARIRFLGILGGFHRPGSRFRSKQIAK